MFASYFHLLQCSVSKTVKNFSCISGVLFCAVNDLPEAAVAAKLLKQSAHGSAGWKIPRSPGCWSVAA